MQSRAPAATSAAMMSSVSAGRITSSGRFGALALRTLVTTGSSLPLAVISTSSCGLSWFSASGKSMTAGIQVQCAGMPFLRSRLFRASTGSRALLTTISGTAAWSDNSISRA
jgi:hypothetical protein